MVAVIVFQILSTTVTPFHTPTAITNETFELNDTLTHTLDHFPVHASSYTLYNETAQTTALTETTHFTLDVATGLVSGVAGIADGPPHNVSIDYTYEESTYIGDGSTRLLFTYITLLVAVAIIASVVLLMRP